MFIMESLPNNLLLKFHPDTLLEVRKANNLDKPGRIDEAVDILEEWVQKQNHFTKKDFSREYLERTLVTAKGLVERTKNRLDKLCTFKTLMPDFFAKGDSEIFLPKLDKYILHTYLPHLTKDYYRVYFFKLLTDQISATVMFDYYKYVIIASEYMKKHEYCVGYIIVFDLSDINILNLMTHINPVDLRQALTLLMEGYGMRMKGLHVITPSKMVDALVGLLKQVLNEKLSQRIHVHKTIETLYEFVEKDTLSEEYGGKEKSLKIQSEQWNKVLNSNEHMEYVKEMYSAKTDEACRPVDKFNENYVGMPGSFRSLTVD